MKKGFSLSEVTVAMALVVIISVIAFSTCNFSIYQSQKSMIQSFFIGQTQNFVNCYYLGETGYANGIKFLTDKDVIYGQDATIYYAKDFSVSTDEQSEYYVNLKFVDEKFSVKCFANSNQRCIFEIEV